MTTDMDIHSNTHRHGHKHTEREMDIGYTCMGYTHINTKMDRHIY